MKHQIRLRTRFADTDMLGHINNAAYFTYMEEARVRFIEENAQLEKMPLILASAKVDYRAQTYYGENLVIESWVSRIGNSSFDMSCQMRKESTGEVAFESVAVLVHFHYESQRSAPIPPQLRQTLEDYLDVPLYSQS